MNTAKAGARRRYHKLFADNKKTDLVERLLLKPMRVASGGNVGGTEAAVEPTRTYSRRFPQEVSRVDRTIARGWLSSQRHDNDDALA